MLKIIMFENEKKYINAFLKLPKVLYKNNNTEDRKTTEMLLLGKHPLNKYFQLHKFIVYDGNQVVGRFVITTYPDDNIAYLGLYECIQNDEVAGAIFKKAYEFCKANCYLQIVGPVDCSFWIKYRLKVNMFEKPYTSEPYNKEDYLNQFLNNGYEICEKYGSNVYEKFEMNYMDEKAEHGYKIFEKKGYTIVKPNKETFDKSIREVYKMIMELYSDFPIFKPISESDFLLIFGKLSSIVNYDMIRMAYYQNEAVRIFYLNSKL